jgi:alkyl hydroperoxide reductase subunit F
MLDEALVTQLTQHLTNITQPIALVASLDDSPKAREMAELLEQVASLSSQVAFTRDGTADRRPSFEIRRVGTDVAVTFAAIPLGHELTSFVLALLQVGATLPPPTPSCSSGCATSKVTTTSRPTCRSRARTARTSSRR